MNILPKKSWHVRNKKNIERVRRDEEEAARLEGIERDRILRAEQEARLRELRARAGLPDVQTNQSGHINLFENSQDHQQTTNKDYEKEKREDELKFQQKSGILNKLVRDDDVNKPWYCDRRSYQKPKSDIETPNNYTQSKESNGQRGNFSNSDSTFRIYDPMTAIKEAERKAKEKQLQEIRQFKQLTEQQGMKLQNYEFYRNVPPPHLPIVKPMLPAREVKENPPRSASKPDSDSSPEIVKIVTSKDKKRAEKRNRRKHKSKKSKKHHHRHKSSRNR